MSQAIMGGMKMNLVSVGRLRLVVIGTVVMLLSSGCDLSVAPATAPTASGATRVVETPSPVVGSASATPATGSLDSVIVEPAAGMGAIYSAISGAKTSVDLVMYELEDQEAEQLLAQAKERGVDVRVILDQAYAKSQNEAAYSYLADHGVAVHWSSSKVDITHQKTLVVDDRTAWIMTGNLTAVYYSSTRDFIVVDTAPSDVAAIEATFTGDYDDTAAQPSGGADLVWSPGSESRLVNLVDSAKSEILVENEEMDEPYIESALEGAAQRGVTVDVCMTNSSSWSSEFSALSKDGVHVRTYAANASLYIHAKVVLVDPGKATAKVFVGSENFSVTSLLKNRELGVVLTDPTLVGQVAAVVSGDFRGATPTT